MYTILLSLLRTVLTIQGFLFFLMNFKIVSRSVKNVTVILMSDASIPQIPVSIIISVNPQAGVLSPSSRIFIKYFFSLQVFNHRSLPPVWLYLFLCISKAIVGDTFLLVSFSPRSQLVCGKATNFHMLAQICAYLNLHSAYERKHGICASELYTFICICYMSVCTKGEAESWGSQGHSDQTVFSERAYLKKKKKTVSDVGGHLSLTSGLQTSAHRYTCAYTHTIPPEEGETGQRATVSMWYESRRKDYLVETWEDGEGRWVRTVHNDITCMKVL